jgi:hypothetical protein
MVRLEMKFKSKVYKIVDCGNGDIAATGKTRYAARNSAT